MTDWMDAVRFDRNGLIPVVTQEASTRDVLMLAWMNAEALKLTARDGVAVYWSRSRQKLWKKGERSGNVQRVVSLEMDCDADVVLLTVEQLGQPPGERTISCHTGHHSCFFRRLQGGRWVETSAPVRLPSELYGD